MAVRKQEFDDNEGRMSQTAKRSRITFDVSPELQRRIKIAALQNNLSLGAYLGRILDDVVPQEVNVAQQEMRPITRESVERLRRLRERILQDRAGRTFEDSSEMIRQMREERTEYLEESQK